MRSLYRILLVWIVLLAIAALFGEVTLAETNVGRTAADFLLIGHGARAAGLGGAYTAVSDEATAAYWNPAGLSALNGTRVSLGHFAWFQDITVEQISLGTPIGDRFSAAVSATYLNYGSIPGYDIDGQPDGDIVAYDWAGGLSLAMALSESVAVGVSGKYVNQRLDDQSASAYAADIGFRYNAESFAVGLTVSNLGSRLQFDHVAEKLPAAARIGLLLRPFATDVATSLEFEKRLHGDFFVRQGLELGFSDMYYLRAGYDYLTAQQGRQLAMGMSLGGGVRLDFAEFDYAFTPNDKSTSEDLHRFTLTFLFGVE